MARWNGRNYQDPVPGRKWVWEIAKDLGCSIPWLQGSGQDLPVTMHRDASFSYFFREQDVPRLLAWARPQIEQLNADRRKSRSTRRRLQNNPRYIIDRKYSRQLAYASSDADKARINREWNAARDALESDRPNEPTTERQAEPPPMRVSRETAEWRSRPPFHNCVNLGWCQRLCFVNKPGDQRLKAFNVTELPDVVEINGVPIDDERWSSRGRYYGVTLTAEEGEAIASAMPR